LVLAWLAEVDTCWCWCGLSPFGFIGEGQIPIR
jgi:hypothetical protein